MDRHIVEIENLTRQATKYREGYRRRHNAYLLGKLLQGLSAPGIVDITQLSFTELPTEAVESNLCRVQGARQSGPQC